MADPGQQERLFPSLLDRLTDDHAGKQTESRDDRSFSVHKLRAAVLRDLGWLMNTSHLSATQDLSDYPLAEKSVINFGIPDLTGKTVSGLRLEEVQLLIRQAILDYEPRIIPQTLQVRGKKSGQYRNAFVFEIEGELWSQPYTERLSLTTGVDLDTGTISVNEA